MINLLPGERKAEIRAARANVVLIRYTLIMLLALGFIFCVLYTSHTLLARTKASAETQIATNDTKADVYSSTREQVDALSAQLDSAKTILNQEVRYSRIVTDIGQLMPSGTILNSLPLDSSLFGGSPVQIKAYAKTTSEAVALQEKFKTSPLFSQINIQATNESGGIEGYPVLITMTITLNKSGVQ